MFTFDCNYPKYCARTWMAFIVLHIIWERTMRAFIVCAHNEKRKWNKNPKMVWRYIFYFWLFSWAPHDGNHRNLLAKHIHPFREIYFIFFQLFGWLNLYHYAMKYKRRTHRAHRLYGNLQLAFLVENYDFNWRALHGIKKSFGINEVRKGFFYWNFAVMENILFLFSIH